MNILILAIFMYKKQSDLGHNLSYQHVALLPFKLAKEMLLFHTKICIMTFSPIFPSLVLFSCTEENKLPLLPYNTIGMWCRSPQNGEEEK